MTKPQNFFDAHDIHAVKNELMCPDWEQEFFINGFVILDSIFDELSIAKIRNGLHEVYKYQCDAVGGELNLSKIQEKGIVRSPFCTNVDILQNILLNEKLLNFVDVCLDGPSILYSQVGVISSPNEDLYQRRWHREIQYQHFTSSKPLMVQILVPLRDFTIENGGTEFMPGTHHIEGCPSRFVREKLARTVNIRMGQVILMNSMLYHRSGINRSSESRELITTAYARPFIAPQFNHKDLLSNSVIDIINSSERARELLGFRWNTSDNFENWRKMRIINEN